jgi:diguanylate cyclase (GGDEF)-like protein
MSRDINFLSPGEPVDLNNCDREPIHIPSAIQPHGVLLAARLTDLQLVYASENARDFLGVSAVSILESTLPNLLGEQAVAAVEESLGQEQYLPTSILRLSFPHSGDTLFEVSAHRAAGLLCIELELVTGTMQWDTLATRMQRAIQQLRYAKTLEGLLEIVPPIFREFTGYDRVMVYRFNESGHGEVAAEERAPEMEPFLGLHYPATDIPRQARQLYLLQRLRMIVDVGYRPVSVLARPDLAAGEPLDMSYCSLRSISPLHLEYLQNMGVHATLAMSLIHKNDLWGMVVCHHRTSRRPPAEVRSLCDLLGQLISLLIGMKLESDEYAERVQKKDILDVLSALIEGDQPIVKTFADHASESLALLRADGAVIRLGGQTHAIGKTPPPSETQALVAALRSTMVEGIAATEDVGAAFPQFAHLAKVASGVVVVQVMNQPEDGIAWFRGEFAQTVRWAGRPDATKQASEQAGRLRPRSSFAAWEEIQRGRSMPWRSSEIKAAQGVQRMITRALLHRTEAKLAQLSNYDPLTNLPNRRVLIDRLEAWQRSNTRTPAALLFLDLDNFKSVNDSLGHQVGDELLRQVADRLGSFANEQRLVARLGGDEFVIFYEGASTARARVLAEAIVQSFKSTFLVDGTPFRTTTSIGIAAVNGTPGEEAADPLRSADAAMYESKQRGGNQVVVGEDRQHEKALRQLHLEQGLFLAVENAEVFLEYQPQFACGSGHLLGFEVLIRWTHPTYGLIMPGEFIPLAEKIDQIVPLGAWVLHSALQQICDWRARFTEKLTVSVNVSAKQMCRADFTNSVLHMLQATGVPTTALRLEVTESILMQDQAVVHIGELRSTGITVSIDDFGTGYSTLAALQRLSVDEVKIDKSFVNDVADNPRTAALFGAMVHMAHNLDAKVMAEGVESEKQWNCIRNLGCDGAQGYFLSKPLSSQAVETTFLSRH